MIVYQSGFDRVQIWISGAGISPVSRIPRGIAIISGCSRDSNQIGEPHSEQKHRSPRPELNFEILAPDEVTVNFAVSAIAHAAGEVPENFLQFPQWQ